DRCLGCMACVTACPSGVQYDKLIEATRPQVERNHRRTLTERLWRRALFAAFTHPARLRVMVPLLSLYRRSGLEAAVGGSRVLDRWPRLRAMERLTPPVSAGAMIRRLPELTPAAGAKRARVGLLQGCVQRVFFHHVNEATVRVLAADGFEVVAPASVRCCGALMLHSGHEAKSFALAKDMIRAFGDCDFVAVNAAGCGSSMKDYGHLLRDDPEWSAAAKAFSDKVRDVSELLEDFGPVAKRHPIPMSVAYHDACHLAHAQGVRRQPRDLLRRIPDLTLAEPAEWEVCCGSAGIYNLLQPEAGEALGRRKAENLRATKARAVAAGNPGCTLQITRHLEEQGDALPVYHPVELLDMSIRGAPPPEPSPRPRDGGRTMAGDQARGATGSSESAGPGGRETDGGPTPEGGAGGVGRRRGGPTGEGRP
ncbi:MAG: (Fe-S)-binding protein, partial [Actinobacteria bacterium]|nr:(Fe-S)-binding protein [Actinomycetota bacterium]